MLQNTTELLSGADEVLRNNGFTQVTKYGLEGIDSVNQSIFEDAFSIVAITVFSTWAELFEGWSEAQSALVELVSEHVAKDEKKVWDCYLLLWTLDLVPLGLTDKRRSIQYDTGRVRKLISSGDDFKQLSDIERCLLPLLPIDRDLSQTNEPNILNRLPALLESTEVSRQMTEAVVSAFESQESLADAIHRIGETK